MDKKTVKKISKILNPTEEQKEKIFASILEKSKNLTTERKGRMPMKRLRPTVAAIVACCLIVTTAFAAVHLGLDTGFFNFLKISNNEQADHLANGAYHVDKQVVNKNGTLKIKQVIGDSNLTYILMDFTAAEGVILGAERYRFNPCDVDIDTYNATYGVGFTKLEDENPNDNKISLVMTMNTEKSLVGGNIKLAMGALEAAANLPKTFKEATAVNPNAQVFKPYIRGNWASSFKLDFKDCSRTYEPNRKLVMYGYEATLQSISISPISITIKVDSPYTREISSASSSEAVEYNTYLDSFPVTISYKDGTKETTTYFNGTTISDNISNTTVSIKTFKKVINDKEIESIAFFDTVIAIN